MGAYLLAAGTDPAAHQLGRHLDVALHAEVLAQREGSDEIKYIHGKFGEGFWTFYGGHDPEDYRHQVGDPPTQLALHKNSPGYRLILNNVLFPAARKKELKT